MIMATKCKVYETTNNVQQEWEEWTVQITFGFVFGETNRVWKNLFEYSHFQNWLNKKVGIEAHILKSPFSFVWKSKMVEISQVIVIYI